MLLHPAAKWVAWLLCALPLVGLMAGVVFNALGANPAEALIRSTGDWTLRMLCVALAVTPVRVMSGTPQLARFRRLIGLWVYAYAVLHFTSYAWLDMGFDAADIAKDTLKRPFIWLGLTGLMLLTPLAATSFNRAIRAVGARRWQRLHRLVYGVAFVAVLHFFWMRSGKNDFTEVFAYAAVLALLLGWRVWHFLRKNRA